MPLRKFMIERDRSAQIKIKSELERGTSVERKERGKGSAVRRCSEGSVTHLACSVPPQAIHSSSASLQLTLATVRHIAA